MNLFDGQRELRTKDSAIRVNQFRFSRDVFQRNYDELLAFVDHFCAPSEAFSYSRVDQKWLWYESMDEIARLLHNFVAAALSLVDHTRVLYRQLYEPLGELSDYPSRVNEHFANDPLIQFVIKLRQMTQHYRLPSIENHTEIKDVKNGLAGSVKISLRLKANDLQKFDSWNAAAKKFIDASGPHIDVRDVITRYFAQVSRFYEWFDQRQRELHGIGPDLLRHLSMHGVSVGSRQEVADLADAIARLEEKPRAALTFAELEAAFDPVLSIVDSRLLMLCRHDGARWIEVALSAAQRRFAIPEDLQARIRQLLQSD